MNRPIRRIALAVLLLFGALLVNANVLQVGEASSLRRKPQNVRIIAAEYSRQRGPIVVGGRAVARSVATKDRLKFQRVYPGGPAFAPATGYYSLVYGASAIERVENEVLSGTDSRLLGRRLSDLLTGRAPQGGAVVLTLDRAAQLAAYQGLNGRRGAVAAIDPRTGAILALASSPSYDPAKLSSHDPKAIRRYWQSLQDDPAKPLLDRALNATYPPGSMFKIVTAAAALSSGNYQPGTRIPAPTELPLPLTTATIKNFGGESCGNGRTDSLLDAFRISCNTAFAALGLALGQEKLRSQAEAFGLNNPDLAVPLPTATSVFPSGLDKPALAQSAIGQRDVRLTPLQAAMLSAAVANDGVLMKPYLVAEEQAPDLATISTASPQRLSRAVSPRVAAQLTTLMTTVVESGTGTAAQIPGVRVAGKTGTAQHTDAAGNPLPPYAWFTAFAPADNPRVAVAVVVENAGGFGSDATGGAVSAPIARAVIQAVLGSS